MATTHHLSDTLVHYTWDKSIPSRLTVNSGDTVIFECQDATGGVKVPWKPVAEQPTPIPRGHALTGPVWMNGAKPGDTLVIEVLDFQLKGWGFTHFRPGAGLLQEEFDYPYLHHWDLSSGQYADLKPGVRVPLDPFLGCMGVAPAGDPSKTGPPREFGGNMDVRHLTKGSTLYLPIQVEGALFSCGDGHAAQGDGEVCISAIECPLTATLRFSLWKDHSIVEPQFMKPGALTPKSDRDGYFAVTAYATDLMEGTKKAIRFMIDHLVRRHNLTREEAYVLCSVAVDLKISEVVDAPHWVVSAYLPMCLFATDG